jgi:hypothetical protein
MEEDVIWFLPLDDNNILIKNNQKYIKYVSDTLYIKNKLERTTSCDYIALIRNKKILHLSSTGILMAHKKVKFMGHKHV